MQDFIDNIIPIPELLNVDGNAYLIQKVIWNI